MRTLHFHWSWLLPAPPDLLWPLVSDTNRFNRDVGLPPVRDARRDGETLENARRRLRLRVLGVPLEWEELPFEWLRPVEFGVVRRYARGPLREMRVRATLEDRGGGRTLLRYRVAAEPRGLAGLLAAALQIGVVSRVTFGRVFRSYAGEVRHAAVARSTTADSSTGSATGGPAARRSDGAGARARSVLVDAGAPPELAGRLLDHLRHGDDLGLARIRPYVLARVWGAPRRDVLRLCLRAVRAGVLRLQWDLVCPGCLGARERVPSLRELRRGGVHCDTCRITFDPNFQDSVEISFTPAEAVRSVQAPTFCVAGPQITPHVEVQQLLAAGEVRECAGVLTPGRHRVRAWGLPTGPSFMVEVGGADRAVFAVDGGGWAPLTEPVAPSATLVLANRTEKERLFHVESVPWADEAATAAEVTALHEFRDLFSGEVLDAGEFVEVGSLAVLFTDLRGSTSLYRSMGDAPAFGLVARHLEELERTVASADGAVVKTIGDAVMAVFRRPVDAVRAVHRGRRSIRAGGEPLVLKAGIHFGPCIAVTLNERLDYFGTTVNLAARLGHLSQGDDLVLSEEMVRDPEVRELLVRWGCEVTPTTAQVRGFEEPVSCVRVQWMDDAAERS